MSAPHFRKLLTSWGPLYALGALEGMVAIRLVQHTEWQATRYRVGNRMYVAPYGSVIFNPVVLARRAKVSRGCVLSTLQKLDDWRFAKWIRGSAGWPGPEREPVELDHSRDHSWDQFHSFSPGWAPSLLVWRDRGESLGIPPPPKGYKPPDLWATDHSDDHAVDHSHIEFPRKFGPAPPL